MHKTVIKKSLLTFKYLSFYGDTHTSYFISICPILRFVGVPGTPVNRASLEHLFTNTTNYASHFTASLISEFNRFVSFCLCVIGNSPLNSPISFSYRIDFAGALVAEGVVHDSIPHFPQTPISPRSSRSSLRASFRATRRR
jgi:hypothetical protein